jgi:hypothetical protein
LRSKSRRVRIQRFLRPRTSQGAYANRLGFAKGFAFLFDHPRENRYGNRTGETASGTRESVRSVEVVLSSGFLRVLQRKSLEPIPEVGGN